MGHCCEETPGQSKSKVCFFSVARCASTMLDTLRELRGSSPRAAVFSSLKKSIRVCPLEASWSSTHHLLELCERKNKIENMIAPGGVPCVCIRMYNSEVGSGQKRNREHILL